MGVPSTNSCQIPQNQFGNWKGLLRKCVAKRRLYCSMKYTYIYIYIYIYMCVCVCVCVRNQLISIQKKVFFFRKKIGSGCCNFYICIFAIYWLLGAFAFVLKFLWEFADDLPRKIRKIKTQYNLRNLLPFRLSKMHFKNL